MKVKEAVALLLSAKSKKKGIDKDSKDIIKELEKSGAFDDDMLKNYFWLSENASKILRIKNNDYFDVKEVGRSFLNESLKILKIDQSSMVAINILKVVSYTDNNEWTGGLNDQKWANDILEYILKNIELDMHDYISLAEIVNDNMNDKIKSNELLQIAEKKAKFKIDLCTLANALFNSFNEIGLAKKIAQDAMNSNLPYREEDNSDLDNLYEELK